MFVGDRESGGFFKVSGVVRLLYMITAIGSLSLWMWFRTRHIAAGGQSFGR